MGGKLKKGKGFTAGVGGEVVGTELMPRWGVGNTELGGGKLKKGKGKRKPNFGVGPNRITPVREIGLPAILYPQPKMVKKIMAIE